MRKLNIAIFFLFLFCACVDPFTLKSIKFQGQLVVDGFITTQQKQHEVKLSRTSPINKSEFVAESNAQVKLKIGNGFVTLSEAKPGVYLTPPVAGTVGVSYKLFITTLAGKQYESQEVILKDTPSIKKVYAEFSSSVPSLNGASGVQIFLDTEDVASKSLYYRWEYVETWEVQTPFESNFVWTGGNNVQFRSPSVSTCYPSDTSTNIIVRSTLGQVNSNVKKQGIRVIPADGQFLAIRYSILVRQYVLSEEGYRYWETLRKVNQTQGTLYDTQPGKVIGNVISVSDPEESVLGYFDASAVQESRVFFAPRDFREFGFVPTEFYKFCSFITPLQIPDTRIGEFLSRPENKGLEIIGTVGFGPSTIFLMPKSCCNCTDIGTNKKPSFW